MNSVSVSQGGVLIQLGPAPQERRARSFQIANAFAFVRFDGATKKVTARAAADLGIRQSGEVCVQSVSAALHGLTPMPEIRQNTIIDEASHGFPPNQLLLDVLAKMADVGKDLKPVYDPHSLDYLREARDGGMYGEGPDEESTGDCH